MKTPFIYNLTQESLPLSVGTKAINLQKIYEMGHRIPVTYCCSWNAYASFQQDGESVFQQLRDEIAAVIDTAKSYVVRSSADVEDSEEHSFAGQFSSILDVVGLEAILQAIQEVWNSSQLEGIHTYQARVGDHQTVPRMAVILQEMVSPVLSGVVFSKNPITGLDETIVEAVEGPGTLLVQDGISPLRWISKWGQWREQPSGKESYGDTIQAVVDQTGKMVKRCGRDLDLEWVFDGRQLWWVQLREITAADNIHIYSNKFSKEFLPGMIKPLVWSVNIPLVNGAWVKLLTELIGENEIDAGSLARSFYYRAYFDTTTFGKIFDLLGMPRQALEINMGLVEPPDERPSFRLSLKMARLLPRLMRFLFDKWRFAKKVERDFSQIESRLLAIAQVPTDRLTPQELLEKIDQLYLVVQEAAYYNIVVPMLMGAYNGALRSQLKYYQLEIERFDLTRDLSGMAAYTPDSRLEQLSLSYRSLDPERQDQIRQADYHAFQQMAGIGQFQTEVGGFISQFGHLSDSGNDFSVPPWREDPDLILTLITSYVPKESHDNARVGLEDLPVRVPRHWLLSLFYQRARMYHYYRERVSSVYTSGYGLFRDYYLNLADFFVQENFLKDRDDIFYLRDKEVRLAAAGIGDGAKMVEAVAQRRLEMEEYREVALPEVIFGDEPPPPLQPSAGKLRGLPAAGGIYTGRVRVVSGLADFNKVNRGDVIVIPFSDVGWTPLFSKAGAIIAESGGLLSHSSIVAREYHIPAVVSVENACAMANNSLVTVDGYLGDILIHETDEELGENPEGMI